MPLSEKERQVWKEFYKDHEYINEKQINPAHVAGASVMMAWLIEKHLDPAVAKFKGETEAHDKTYQYIGDIMQIANYGLENDNPVNRMKAISSLQKVKDKARKHYNGG